MSVFRNGDLEKNEERGDQVRVRPFHHFDSISLVKSDPMVKANPMQVNQIHQIQVWPLTGALIAAYSTGDERLVVAGQRVGAGEVTVGWRVVCVAAVRCVDGTVDRAATVRVQVRGMRLIMHMGEEVTIWVHKIAGNDAAVAIIRICGGSN